MLEPPRHGHEQCGGGRAMNNVGVGVGPPFPFPLIEKNNCFIL